MNNTDKINKDEFIARAAERCDVSVSNLNRAYDAFVETAAEVAKDGKTLALTGFGKFYVQRHKGHPVQFGDRAGEVDPYVVYKFSASNVFNNELRKADKAHTIKID